MTERLTAAQRRSARHRNVGRLDDGRLAFPVRKGDTEEMARLAFAWAYDDGAVVEGQEVVDWCRHSADYAYRHGCADWCDNPSPALVWVARRHDPSR